MDEAVLRCDESVRLTRPEEQRGARITGFQPVGIRTVNDLRRYVMRCKKLYRGTSDENCLLHWLIDQEIMRCVGQLAAPG